MKITVSQDARHLVHTFEDMEVSYCPTKYGIQITEAGDHTISLSDEECDALLLILTHRAIGDHLTPNRLT